MLRAPTLSWLTALLTIVILAATVIFVVGSASGSDAASTGLWRSLLPVTLVMGCLGGVVLVLSLLSPTVPVHIRSE